MSTGRSSGAEGYVGALVQSKTLLSPRDIQEVGGAADTKQAGSGHRQHKGESSSVKVCAAGDVTGFSEREFTQMASLGSGLWVVSVTTAGNQRAKIQCFPCFTVGGLCRGEKTSG